MNLHTLILLDIRVKEISNENLAKGRKVYEDPKFMDCRVCAQQLLEIEAENMKNVYNKNTMCVGLARIGHRNQKIVNARLEEFLDIDMGKPLHSFIICSPKPHFMELDMLKLFSLKTEKKNGKKKKKLKKKSSKEETKEDY